MSLPSLPERFEEIQDLFDEIIDLSLEERLARLEEVRRSDSELCREVETLLEADDAAAAIFGAFDGLIPTVASPRKVRLEPGDVVGSYTIVDVIGSGGMGVVYLAHDETSGREVALKVLNTSSSADSRQVVRLRSEAQAAAALDHPHVVTVYEVGATADYLFLAMPYYESESLRQRIDHDPLPLREVFDIGVAVATGLAAAHRQGIVHRDIKPANILITEEGIIKIVDFGIATSVDPVGDGEGRAVGTLAYMSPEQVRGRPVDYRTDLWSLGVVLYEMLSGELPFHGLGDKTYMQAILSNPPIPLVERCEEVPEELNAVIDRLLVKDVDERWQYASDLAVKLHELSMGGAFMYPPSAVFSFRRPLPEMLPTLPSRIIGREKERMEIGDLLARARLVTLTGPPGIGKTRLSLEVARAMQATFPDGVAFVTLEHVLYPDLVTVAIAQALGVREMGGLSVRECLVRFLKNKRALLVLDHVDQVLDAVPLGAELLASCSDLKLLVPNRTPLGLQGEWTYPVGPLTIPGEGASAFSESEKVFEERARMLRPDFTVTGAYASGVTRICTGLEGVPLAIELMAVWPEELSLPLIVRLLEQRLELIPEYSDNFSAPPRPLRAAMSMSYAMLTEEKQAFFRRLAVFAGGCTVETVSALCRKLRMRRADVSESLALLADRNVLKRIEEPGGETRFLMPDVLRRYGLELFAASGEEDTVRRAHLRVFLDLAEEAEEHLTGSDQAEWLLRLQKEHHNLRTALDFAQDVKAHEDAARLGIALWRFWLARGYLNEGACWLERLLNLKAPPGNGPVDPSGTLETLRDEEGDM